jgi:hypothetical protein
VATTLRTEQIRDAAITASKAALSTGSWHFSGSATLRAPSSSPSNALDVASKGYVDSLVQGLRWKEPAQVATTANLVYTYSNGTSGVGATLTAGANGAIAIDGETLASGDRVLVWKQTTTFENGVYKVTTVGDGSNPAVLTRSTDADTPAELNGLAIFVLLGGSADTGFVLSTDLPITIGTTGLTFVPFTGASAIVAGDGINKVGSTLSVKLNATNPGLVVDGAGLVVKVKATSGITKDADGLSVALAANKAIEFSSGALALKTKANAGTVVDADGLSVALAANKAIEFSSGALALKTKANAGTVVDADGLAVALAANKGLEFQSGALAVKSSNGVQVDNSGFVTLLLDGGTLSTSGSGAKVSDNGITGAQFGMRPRFDAFVGDGTVVEFSLANLVNANHLEGVCAFVNGQRAKKVASAPADAFEYTVANVSSVTKVTFGAAPVSGDAVFVDSISG